MNMKNGCFAALVRTSVIVAVILAGLSTSTAFADEWYVKEDGDDTDSGTDWGSAWATISNAVANAAPLDTILVSNGTYGVTAQIVVDKAVSIIGQGAREATIVERVGAQQNRIFNLSDADALVANLTIRKGYVEINGGNGGNDAFSGGGGIIMTDGIVSNCVITANTNNPSGAEGSGYPYGGGVSMSGGTLWDCTVSSNKALGYGSYGQGVYMRNGGTIRDSIVIRNRGRSSNDQRTGAGIFMLGGGMVTNTDIIANGGVYNSASRVGGVYCSGGTVVDSTIVSNMTVGVQLTGGAALSGGRVAYTHYTPWSGECNVYLTGSSVVTNCTIHNGVSAVGVSFASHNSQVVDCVVSNESSGAFTFSSGKTNNLVQNGTVYNSNVGLGSAATANANHVLVTGSGELWNLNGKNVTIGNASSVGNEMTITDDGTVDNIGTLSVLGASNSVNLLGGTLGVKTTTYPAAFVAGDGTQDATLKLLDGTLTFSSGVTITNNATLAGSGTLVADTTVFGSLSPGLSVGGITNDGTLTLMPDATTTIELAADTQPGVGWDLVAVDTGALELDGDLYVAVTNGFAPTDAQSFVIMTNTVAASVSGAFDNTSNNRVMVYDGIGGKAIATFGVVIGSQSVVLDSYAELPVGTAVTIR